MASLTMGKAMWRHDYQFNWCFANAEGEAVCAGVAGNFGNATATPYQEGEHWYVDVVHPLPGGGRVRFIRGVYLATEVFNWPGFWADPRNPRLTNYYHSFSNQGSVTKIRLTGNPGGLVQLYYVYATGETFAKYDGVNVYPYPKKWLENNTYTMDYAVDKLLEAAAFIWLEGIYRDLPTDKQYRFLWEEFKRYSESRQPPLLLDDFRRSAMDAFIMPVYIDSTGGMELVRDCALDHDRQQRFFRFQVELPETGDAAWYGYYFGVENLDIYPWNNIPSLILKYRGYNQGNRLRIQINVSSPYAEDKYTNLDYIYEHVVRDRNLDWVLVDIPASNFIRGRNIYYDADRVPCNTWSYQGGGAEVSHGEEAIQYTYGDQVAYSAMRLQWTAATPWVLLGFANGSDYYGSPANELSLKFHYYLGLSSAVPMQINVKQEGDIGARIANIGASSLTVGQWAALSVPYNAFTPNLDPDKSVVYIEIVLVNVPSGGFFRINHLRFGDFHTFTNEAQRLLLVQCFVERWTGGQAKQRFDIGLIKFGPYVTDPYPYCPRLAISLREYGQHYWRGPTPVHYTFPLVPYICGDTNILAIYLAFINDAMLDFNRRYAGMPGPTMPCHSRNDLENIAYLGVDDFNRFSWWRRFQTLGKRVAAWNFNESLVDAEGKHNLTAYGTGHAYVAGICQPGNTAWANDGSSRYLYHDAHSDFLFGNRNFAIEAVVRFNTTAAGTSCIAGVWDGSTNNRSWILYRSAAVISFAYSQDGATAAYVSGSGIVSNKYHHVVVTRDGNTIYVYIDGTLRASSEFNVTLYNANVEFRVGRSYTGWPGFFDGSLDFLAIYNGYSMTADEVYKRWLIVNGRLIGTDYPEAGTGLAQNWVFKKAAEYYCLTGDDRIKPYLQAYVAWLKQHAIDDPAYPNDPKGVAIPMLFDEYGYRYLFNFGESDWTWGTEGAAKGLLFWYWRTGDQEAAQLLRRILDDLRVNRWRNGYYQGQLRYLGGYGNLLRLWGLVVNGRPPGYGFYDFPVTAEDKAHFEEIYQWVMANKGDTKPATLSQENIPYYYYEDYENWDSAPYYISLPLIGTYEAVVNCLGGALEWGRYSGDYTWYEQLKNFILSGGTNMSDKLAIINMALIKLGEMPVTSLTEENKALSLLLNVYDSVRDQVLRDHHWKFALKTGKCVQLFNGLFQVPPDCLKVVSANVAQYELTHGGIKADTGDLEIRYVARVMDEAIFDQLFVGAFAVRLAATVAYAVTGSQDREKRLLEEYEILLQKAKSVDSQEAGVRQFLATDWLEARF